MPRKPRVLEPGLVYHVFNRRTDRQRLFPTPSACDDFVELLAKARHRYSVAICSYCVMESHWHQAVWVRDQHDASAVANYLRWLSACHAIRFRSGSATRGEGHVYQDRYKSKPVCTAGHYVTLMRYIEANPLEAGLVERAENWSWSSLAERESGKTRIITSGPVPLPPTWCEIVNARCQFGDYTMLE